MSEEKQNPQVAYLNTLSKSYLNSTSDLEEIDSWDFTILVEDIQKSLKKHVAASDNIPASEIKRLYKEGNDFISEIRGAFYSKLNEFKNEKVWKHHHPAPLTRHSTKYDLACYDINIRDLEKAASIYIKNEWLRSDFLDWMLLDSMIHLLYRKEMQNEYVTKATMKKNYFDYFVILIFYATTPDAPSAKEEPKIVHQAAIVTFLLRYVLPPVMLFLLDCLYSAMSPDTYRKIFISKETFFSIGQYAMIGYAGYLLIRLALWPVRVFRRRAVRRELEAIKRRVSALNELYSQCKGPTINIESLTNAVDSVRKSGTITPGTLSALIEIIKSDKKNLFV